MVSLKLKLEYGTKNVSRLGGEPATSGISRARCFTNEAITSRLYIYICGSRLPFSPADRPPALEAAAVHHHLISITHLHPPPTPRAGGARLTDTIPGDWSFYFPVSLYGGSVHSCMVYFFNPVPRDVSVQGRRGDLPPDDRILYFVSSLINEVYLIFLFLQ